jgi:hypothetical protein
MATVKTVLLFLLLGAVLGVLGVSFVAPGYLQWDNTPSSGQALCDCGKTTREVATRLLTAQAEAGGVGAVLGLVLGIVIEVRARKKSAPAAAPAA